ncbi:MAG: chemotaxis response regulator protein-glutamate methylesterase [Rhodocyclaceae bacterium]|nr:chemotaxis response regulator protein-glutamate methylesterase [Rhodocyclaceae bacterium]
MPEFSRDRPIRVIIVDDSAVVRAVLAEIINAEPDMTVVGLAADPFAAREAIRVHDPDVITLDVEMPRMDGLDFLEKLMRLRPTPVVMISTLTERGSEAALRALELGAIDFVAKPKVDVRHSMAAYSSEIAQKLRVAAQARLLNRRRSAPPVSEATAGMRRPAHPDQVIAIGASTGGTEAIKDILVHMPPDCPPIVITQHMPEGFTRMFAARLNRDCRITVREAQHGDRLQPGVAFIAPGNRHLLVRKRASGCTCELSDAEPVSRHKPSVDVLFSSVAAQVGRHAIGVILTGMGRDGAAGMAEMKQAGAWNIAQDEQSCVVFGMPKEAINAGGVDAVLPLDAIFPHLMERVGA